MAPRILFVTPAYWPAVNFGGPIWVTRELAEGLTSLGHDVRVYTTSLVDLEHAPARTTTTRTVEGVPVRYLATPLRYRWMGITPSLPSWLRRDPAPDVVHVFGYRDFVGTAVAAWCRSKGVPYVFEPLGMFLPRFRKLRTKRILDWTLARRVAESAALVIATSELERADLLASGLRQERVVVRPNGFPPPLENGGGRLLLRERLGLTQSDPLLLYVGRVASYKGLELILEALTELPGAHFAIVGPDEEDGTLQRLSRTVAGSDSLKGRVHLVGPSDTQQPLRLYAEADVFVLPSRNENFGMVAAEAAAAGTPVVLTDQCGVAEFLGDRAALVVPCAVDALRDAVRRLLSDEGLRRKMGEAGRDVAQELSWPNVCRLQASLYEQVLE